MLCQTGVEMQGVFQLLIFITPNRIFRSRSRSEKNVYLAKHCLYEFEYKNIVL